MLTRKQERFVQEYVKDLNGKQAALRAGYGRKTASKQMSRLLETPEIKEAINFELEESKRRNEITKDYLTLLLKEIAEAKGQARNSDRIQAIVTLAKMHNHITDNKQDNSIQTVVIKQTGLQEPVPTIEVVEIPKQVQ